MVPPERSRKLAMKKRDNAQASPARGPIDRVDDVSTGAIEVAAVHVGTKTAVATDRMEVRVRPAYVGATPPCCFDCHLMAEHAGIVWRRECPSGRIRTKCFAAMNHQDIVAREIGRRARRSKETQVPGRTAALGVARRTSGSRAGQR